MSSPAESISKEGLCGRGGRNSGTRHFSIRVCGMTWNRIWVFPASCCCAGVCVCACVCIEVKFVYCLVKCSCLCNLFMCAAQIKFGCETCTIQKIFKQTLISTWNYKKRSLQLKHLIHTHTHTHICSSFIYSFAFVTLELIQFIKLTTKKKATANEFQQVLVLHFLAISVWGCVFPVVSPLVFYYF